MTYDPDFETRQAEYRLKRLKYDEEALRWPPVGVCNMAMQMSMAMDKKDAYTPEEIAERVHRIWVAMCRKDWRAP